MGQDIQGCADNPMKDLASSVRVLTAEVQASQEQARTAPAGAGCYR